MNQRISLDDGPRGFEERAIATARALHDPMGLQGSQMVLGRERDAVFIDDASINCYEFTTSGLKAKSQKDAEKLVELIKHLAKAADNRYKSATGWLITESEPSAEQREVVRRIGLEGNVTLHILSFQALRSRLCNVEDYLAARSQAPFGSIAYTQEQTTVGIEPAFQLSLNGEVGHIGVKALVDRVNGGERVLLTGEFGVGKSHSLRELYREMRRRYFKKPAENPFPIHLNLRDAAGLRSPSEVLRRHAEEIGFANDRGLVSAWRAGACVLLLDGFDEVIPSRWLGSATNLRDVRWEALNPVRRLVLEAPKSSGIVVAGRGHYFSSDVEMQKVLGLEGCGTIALEDFDEQQASDLLQGSGIEAALPSWLPTRPLLLIHLLQRGGLHDAASISTELDAADAWRELLTMICAREAHVYSSVPPETIRSVIARLATVARTKGDPLAPLGRPDLEQVFFDVSGRSTDEESMQLLMRLPGLAAAAPGIEEGRIFADEDLASTAFGEDLADYILDPFQDGLLGAPAAWSDSAPSLAIEVCASTLRSSHVTPGQVLAACDRRMDHRCYDSILIDAVRVADELGAAPAGKSYLVEGVLVRDLTASPDSPTLARTHIRDSVIESLDMSQVVSESDCPTIERCLIDRIEGLTVLPASVANRFPATDISEFSGANATTAGILSSNLGPQERVALSVLHKVYAKRGSGRKESALPRGLDNASQELLPDVISRLIASGWMIKSSRGANTIYLPVKGGHAKVFAWLEVPQSFSLSGLEVLA